MNDALIPAVLAFRDDGTPFSPRHDDIYHSVSGALAQARHVFIGGNALPLRWRGKSRFTVLETGFGMGINFLATWAAWRDDAERPQALEFVSIEKHPFKADDLRDAHDAVVDDIDIEPLADTLTDTWPLLMPGMQRLSFEGGRVALTLFFGDIAKALDALRANDLKADALYLDGFAPAKNPEMWTPQVFRQLAGLTVRDASFATYTSAGTIKRALLEAGFAYRKVPGFGGKRAMLVGTKATDVIFS